MSLVIIRPAAEVGTKSRQTRSHFQQHLRRNIAIALRRASASRTLVQDFGRVYLETDRPEAALRVLPRVFGIGNFSLVEAECAPTPEAIFAAGVQTFAERVRGRRFAVRAKRIRREGISTQLINEGLGGLLKEAGGIVDLDDPEITVTVANNGFVGGFNGFYIIPDGTVPPAKVEFSQSSYHAVPFAVPAPRPAGAP